MGSSKEQDVNKARLRELNRLICEIEKPSVEDSTIVTYQDFLKVRDYISYCQFNLKVFETLINLSVELWHSEKRISRLSLLTTIKRYGFKHGKKPAKNSYPKELNHKLFLLYRYCFESATHIRSSQLLEAKQICNYILINAELPDGDIQWLMNNFHQDERMLNRILRYPIKNALISQWVKEHAKIDALCLRRAEATSWLLDQDPEFIIEKNLLLYDLQRTNAIDQDRINEYESSMALFQMLQESNSGQKEEDHSIGMTEYPELELVRRHYQTKRGKRDPHANYIPNFKVITADYEADLNYHHLSAMLWSIAYSRLDNATKTELLKRYYTPETYHPFVKIASRYQLLDALQWVKKDLDNIR